jgi:zinc D-Ala-D-Ala carboxypeptidase
MNLTTHFALSEFTASTYAARHDIDNKPSEHVLESLRRTALGLEMVRMRLGAVPIHITSGYRSPELNRKVGGSATSQHMKGEAVDFRAPRFGRARQIVDALVDSEIEYDQLILEYPGPSEWVHISFVQTRPRHQALVIDRSGTRPLYT